MEKRAQLELQAVCFRDLVETAMRAERSGYRLPQVFGRVRAFRLAGLLAVVAEFRQIAVNQARKELARPDRPPARRADRHFPPAVAGCPENRPRRELRLKDRAHRPRPSRET